MDEKLTLDKIIKKYVCKLHEECISISDCSICSVSEDFKQSLLSLLEQAIFIEDYKSDLRYMDGRNDAKYEIKFNLSKLFESEVK